MRLQFGPKWFHLPVVILVSTLAFALFKRVLDGLVGFSYGESTAAARVVHDVAMMLWGAVMVAVYARLKSESSK